MNDEMNFTLYLSKLSRPEFAKCKIFQMEREKTAFANKRTFKQGDRSCAKARRAFAEKFGLGRKFQALTYAILSRY